MFSSSSVSTPESSKIAILHALQRRLLRHYLHRETVLGALESVIDELRMLLYLAPNGVEGRAEHIDHAGKDAVARNETSASQCGDSHGEAADAFIVGYP